MRISATSIRAAAAGMLLVAGAFVAPASATPAVYKWDLTFGCTQSAAGTNGASGGCRSYGDGKNANTKGNIDKFMSTGGTTSVGLSAEAFHSTSKTNLGPATFLGEYGTGSANNDYGLGAEWDTSPGHSVDNQSGYDFIVIALPTNQFNQVTIDLSSFDTKENMEATIYYGVPTNIGTDKLSDAINGTGANKSTDTNTLLNRFANVTIANLLGGGFASTNTDGLFLAQNQVSMEQHEDITITSQSMINYVIVAASLTSSKSDDFKINSASATNYVYHRCKKGEVQPGRTHPCPEPASVALYGASLLGMGAMARRRKTAKRAA